jgi:hypothetical protein
MLSVITFKYLKPGYRTVYTAAHVNTLRSMVARCYNHPHRFFCVTDDPAGIDPGVEIVPMWQDHFGLINPTHPTNRPNCYPRLKLFSREMEGVFGKRFVSLDLDMVLVDDVAPLWNRPEEFIIYDARGDDHYNGSMFLQTAGTRDQVWTAFDPVESPKMTTRAGMRGSDQAWIRYMLSPHGAATWSFEDGVYAYLNLIPPYRQRRATNRCIVPIKRRVRDGAVSGGAPPARPVPQERNGALPAGARMVIFAGEYKPWEVRTQQMSPWVMKHYR